MFINKQINFFYTDKNNKCFLSSKSEWFLKDHVRVIDYEDVVI